MRVRLDTHLLGSHSKAINSPSTPLSPEELTQLRVKLSRESQRINEALKYHSPEVTTFKMKKSKSSDMLQPEKSAMKKSASTKQLKIHFDKQIHIGATHHTGDYDRKTSPSITAYNLDYNAKVAIRSELNAFKRDMTIHEKSKHNTVYYPY